MGTLTYWEKKRPFLRGDCLSIDAMKSSDRLKKRVIEFLEVIEKSKGRLSVRCGLCVDIVWYRQQRHIRKRLNNGKRIQPGP